MNHFRQWLLTFVFVAIAVITAPLAHAAEISSGEAVVRAMHDRYAKSWYKTLTFTQKSTTYNPDGTTKVETWYESALLPGNLRIDVGPASDRNAYIFSDGNIAVFKEGKLDVQKPSINMLLVMGFDVYGQSVEKSLSAIKGEKYDTTKFHEDTWEGHPVYVVGAEKGDTTSPQFWVDKDRLLFVRLFQPSKNESGKIEDIRFVNYQRLGGGWLAPRVEVHVDGTLVFSEDYSEIKGDPKLDPKMFDTKEFVPAKR